MHDRAVAVSYWRYFVRIPPAEKRLLRGWPLPRSRDWVNWVAAALSDQELERLRWSVKRGCPFGDQAWVESTARRLDLETTLRPRGRPRKLLR